MLSKMNAETLNLRWQAQGFLLLSDKLDLSGLDLAALQPQRLVQRTRGGSRDLLAHELVQSLVIKLRELPEVAALCDPSWPPIQCSYFEKTAQRNWLVAWHQDLSIPVASREQHNDWPGLSCKQGQWFAQAPASYLARCLALRLHLDRCGQHDGALRVLPGTHRHGRLSAAQIESWQQRVAPVSCYAEAGEILLMRPTLLHASSKCQSDSRRRVLHFLFAPVDAGV